MAGYIYRTIDLRIWGDEKVRRLSRPAPNARDLFLYLLTAKESIAVPGLIPAGAAAMAETLRWPAEGLREAFGEVLREGLAMADWEAPLIWIPNAVRYNPPQSPNVVRSWAKVWPGVPDSRLKSKALRTLRAFTEGMGEGYAKAFREAFGDPSPNQDQDQDQDQEEDLRRGEPAPPLLQVVEEKTDKAKPKRERKLSTQEAFYAWAQTERAKKTQSQDEPPKIPVLNTTLGAILTELGAERTRAAYLRYLEDRGYPATKCSPPWPWGYFAAKWRQYATAIQQGTGIDPKKLVGPEDDPYADGAA